MSAQWDTSRYLSLFVGEATEHLEALGQELVRLEGRVNLEAIDSLFRHAHSVKGMASSMGFEGTTTLAHRLEDLLDRVRSSPWRFDAGIADFVLQAVDALQAHVKAAAAQAPFPDSKDLARQLETLAMSIRPGTTPLPYFSPPVPAMVEKAPPPAPVGPPRYLVALRVSPTSAQPGVRGFLAYKRLSTLGDVSRCVPPLTEVKAGKLPGGAFSVELETNQPEELVRRTVGQVSDVDLVWLQRLGTSATPAPEAEGEAAAAKEPQRTLRVRAELLDEFHELSGQLFLSTAALRAVGRSLPPDERGRLGEVVDAVLRVARELHGKVTQARMTPAAVLFDRVPRAARDIARRSGREIELALEGGDIELDRVILDELSEPVLHLLRNAIDHGIEPPAERLAAGKPARGQVKVSVRREQGQVVLELRDDGRGMDKEKLKARAVERGLLSPEQAPALSEAEALLLCTLPGLSTAEAVTDVSGRGVGMDAVKRSVEAVGGTLGIASTRGVGTTFRLAVPVTLSSVPLLLVSVGDDLYGLPMAKVAGVVEPPVALAGGALVFGAAAVPTRTLAEAMGVAGRPPVGPAQPFVVVETEQGRLALAVDAVMGQEEVVLKALHRPAEPKQSLAGVTVLASGRTVVVVEPARLGGVS
jgi:two-component system chemotaxis sensor kinase CheA